jgi:hypothetical protein
VETLLHIALAVAALGVPLACAYLIVRRLGRRRNPGRPGVKPCL